ncbi:DUF2786 domain-containing protein [Rhodococcus tukisamuensis]|uniref:Uncharacterized protein n=1 Tax=Rhodococcus tukisamuensis TaxID=168276 RepID=A0A1G7C900_9NOCA|nr:DUF2786 domain-containing protein [Rhodococcus tukisamuensis]SDE35693.1 Protein of unknown function [Rhodococcus tukisamuensis]
MNDDDAPGAEALALVAAVAAAYERGWQPADLLHVTRRGDESPPELAAAAMLSEARRSRAAERAPSDWTGQLDAVAEQYPAQARLVGQVPAGDPTGRHLAAALTAGRSGFFGYQFAELAAEWNRLPPWTFLTDPPSQWPAEGTTPTAQSPGEDADAPAAAADPKMLNRIRGLLTKAERTEFTQEAETFTAKAQELMTRYAIDAALLRTRAHTGPANVRSRRVHLDNPYVTEKVHLLTAIGEANRVRTVWFGDLSIAVAVGTPADLQQVNLLFTSLLVQANRTLQSTAAQGRSGARTTAFRKAFLAGFASRVGQRLREADARATEAAAADESMPVSDLLPILATTSAAVEAEFNRLFPGTRRSRARSVDAGGWHAGRAAADDASLTPGAGRINRK